MFEVFDLLRGGCYLIALKAPSSTWMRWKNKMSCLSGVLYPKKKALCHNEQTAALLLNFGFGHVLQYTPFILNFSALHFTHSYTTQEGVPKFCISTHPLYIYIKTVSQSLPREKSTVEVFRLIDEN